MNWVHLLCQHGEGFLQCYIMSEIQLISLPLLLGPTDLPTCLFPYRHHHQYTWTDLANLPYVSRDSYYTLLPCPNSSTNFSAKLCSPHITPYLFYCPIHWHCCACTSYPHVVYFYFPFVLPRQCLLSGYDEYGPVTSPSSICRDCPDRASLYLASPTATSSVSTEPNHCTFYLS